MDKELYIKHKNLKKLFYYFEIDFNWLYTINRVNFNLRMLFMT